MFIITIVIILILIPIPFLDLWVLRFQVTVRANPGSPSLIQALPAA